MKILLVVSGSISAYKTFDLLRLYVKDGHKVRVIVSEGAKKFVRLELFSYLGAEEVYGPQADFYHAPVLHVQLAHWADCLILAPLSANTLARLSQGLANDLLTAVFLTYKGPTLAFLAMNTAMLEHPATQKNQKTLEGWGVFFHPPDSGLLACSDEGPGKLPHIDKIHAMTILATSFKKEEKDAILISTGATLAPLDSVRHITNTSSGLTGLYLAKKYLQEGHKVTVLSGQSGDSRLDHFEHHPRYTLKRVKTTREALDFIQSTLPNMKTYFSTAAFCDLEFEVSSQKLKKDQFNGQLSFKKAPDILQTLLPIKQKDQKIIGMAAESRIDQKILEKKWEAKPVDLLVGNTVDSGLFSGNKRGLGTQDGIYSFFTKNAYIPEIFLTKEELAQTLYTWERYDTLPDGKRAR